MAPLITKTRAQIVCKPLPVVEADPVLLEQLFQNLIANALKYHRAEEALLLAIESSLGADGLERLGAALQAQKSALAGRLRIATSGAPD